MTITIRPATLEDATAIAALQRQIIDTTLATFTTTHRTPADWQEDIRRSTPPVLLAETDAGQFLGYATYGSFRGGVGYARTGEHSIYLTEAARGRGVGRKLLTQLENEAQEQGIHVLVAAISSANPAAQAFHAACGYSEVGRLPQVGRKWGQWLDLVLMQKILREEGAARPDSAADPG